MSSLVVVTQRGGARRTDESIDQTDQYLFDSATNRRAPSCSLCRRVICADDQRYHAVRRSALTSSCACAYHVECLIGALQNGRCECVCGEQLTGANGEPIRIVIPRRIDTNVHSSQLHGTTSIVDVDENINDSDNCCTICGSSLMQSSLPIASPLCCTNHVFHLHCLVETAYSPARDRGVDPNCPQFKCPLCRRDIIGIRPHGTSAQILIHYEACEEDDRRSGSINEYREQFVNSRGELLASNGGGGQRQHTTWWDRNGLAVVEVVLAVVIVVGMIFIRR